MNNFNSYEKKVETLKNVANHVDNHRMPILSLGQTWAVAYAGRTTEECLESVDKEIEIFGKHLEDMYFDGIYGFGLSRSLDIYDPLGYASYFISPDKITLQASDDTAIIKSEDEIERFTRNPQAFIREVALSRRYPALQKDYPEDINALKTSFANFLRYNTVAGKKKEEALKNVYQTPNVIGAVAAVPLDMYMRYRGLKESLIDLRRRPQAVMEACEAILSLPMSLPMTDKSEEFPWVMSASTGITFLNPKQFEKVCFPTYKKVLDAYIDTGAKIFVGMEGRWGKEKYQYLNEFPANTFVASVEEDDPLEVQKLIGEKVGLGYPFPVRLLQNGTEQEVVEEAKKIIDMMGTTGVLMFADKALMCPNDANGENYKALSEFCRDYTI